MFTASLAFRLVVFVARLFEGRGRPRHRRDPPSSLHVAAATAADPSARATIGLAGLSSFTISLADPDEASACSTCSGAAAEDYDS